MDLLDHISSVLRAFDIEPRPLDRLVTAYVGRHRELASSERRLVAEAAFGVARWKRRLDGWLKLAGIRDPDHRARALCYLAWQKAKGAHLAAGDRLIAGAGMPARFDDAMPRNFPGGEAAYHSLPDFFWQMLVSEHGAESAAAIASALGEPQSPVLRVNALKCDREAALGELAREGIAARPTGRSPYGIRLTGRIALKGLAAYRDGLIEVQDEASQLAVIAGNPRPGETLFDACAGAGGKGLMAAMLMEGRGRIAAYDPNPAKLKELHRRAARAGVGIIKAAGRSGLGEFEALKGRCDLVLVDAPCSGTGTLRRNPDLRWRLDEAKIKGFAERQFQLLCDFAEWPSPAGRLLYITCSILREENEAVVEGFLERGDFEVADIGPVLEKCGISPAGIVAQEGYMKTDPRAGDWDCLFAALLRKKTTPEVAT